MPLYEGIGMINEKNPVVLEIGKFLTKAGFAGEITPRCIIPSGVSKDGEFRSLANFKDETDLYQLLVEFLHHLYSRHLLVTPKDRKVVVVESIFAPTLWRTALAKVLYLHYEILTVLWIPSHVAAVGATGSDIALVLEFGSEEIQIFPVFRGVTILSAVICHELGATIFDKNLKSLLMESCLTPGKTKEELDSLLTTCKVEDVRVRCCVVTNSSRAKILSAEHEEILKSEKFRPFSYEVDGKNFLQFHGSVREQAAEIWFRNEDLDGVSLPLMILEALSKCPIDTRKILASNILIIGGTAMLLGLKGRLLKELKSLVQNSGNQLNDPVLKQRFESGQYEFKIFDGPVKENCLGWLGGSLWGGSDAMSLRSVSKEFFLKHGLVPDWCNLQFDMINGISSCGISAYGSSNKGL